jgi:thiol-disulfide isomerase/thioredoxin
MKRAKEARRKPRTTTPSDALKSCKRAASFLRGLFLCVISIAVVSSCNISIQKLPSTSYSKLSEEKKERLRYPPDSSFTFTEKDYRSAEDVELYEIDKERLFALMDSSMNAWVYLWATYCPHCLTDLAEHHKKDSARPNMQLFLVSANYDPPIIKKYVYRAGYRKPVFVIDAEQYGNNGTQRMNAFADSVSDKDLDSMNRLPQHFFFKKKEWVGRSGSVNSDSLDHYFNK